MCEIIGCLPLPMNILLSPHQNFWFYNLNDNEIESGIITNHFYLLRVYTRSNWRTRFAATIVWTNFYYGTLGQYCFFKQPTIFTNRERRLAVRASNERPYSFKSTRTDCGGIIRTLPCSGTDSFFHIANCLHELTTVAHRHELSAATRCRNEKGSHKKWLPVFIFN